MAAAVVAAAAAVAVVIGRRQRGDSSDDGRDSWSCDCGQAYLVSGLDRHRVYWLPEAQQSDPLLARESCPAEPSCQRDTTRPWTELRPVLAAPSVYSRRIVGWGMTDHMRSELVVDALERAVAQRRPDPGLIHHSDQGSQYVSLAFGQQAHAAGIGQSMGSRGDCYNNAFAESFFATLKKRAR